MLIAGMRASLESDLKKVVALSTLSQLGVIMISLGALQKSYCFFHMMSHACFKALIFICVGTYIHSIYGTQEYRRFNYIKYLPYISTFITVAILTLLGFSFTSGFYSKDLILERLYENAISVCAFLTGIGLTTCYSIKMLRRVLLMGSFSGSRNLRLGSVRWAIKLPIMILGIFRLINGSFASYFTRVMFVVLSVTDKTIPLILITLGAIVGYSTSRLTRPITRSILFITPITQSTGKAKMDIQSIDKG